MKLFLRLLFGFALALAGSTLAHAAPAISASGLAATPGSAAPGDVVTFNVSVTNTGAVTPTDDLVAGNTANVTITLTHLVSGYTFTRSGSVTNTTTIVGAGGTGIMSGSFAIPTQFTEAGAYRASVVITSISAGTFSGATFSVSTGVLTVTGKPNFRITGLTYASGTSYVGGSQVPMTITWVNDQSTNGTQNVPYVSSVNGMPATYRLKVVLSTNATFGDGDDFQLTIQDRSAKVNADGSTQTYSWTQLLPGNFAGSYYVLAKIDALDALDENDAPALTVNGDNIWGSNAFNPTATLINILPSNFPATALVTHGTGSTNSANAYSDNPSMSADGRYIAFTSDASNLVAGDTNAVRDIFLFDYQTNTSRRVSVSQQGSQANGASNNPALSGNGRYVVFSSEANNLILGDTNGFSDIYAVDTITGLIARMSVATAGTQANNPSFKPAISSTGRYVVFESTATNLDPAYSLSSAGGVSHIYLHDRAFDGSTTFDTPGNTRTYLVDVSSATPATVAGDASAIQAAISSDGTMIAFASRATNLAAAATTANRQHVYIRPTANVGTATAGIKNIDVAHATAIEGNGDGQTPSLSANGAYVAFASVASNLLGAPDTNGVSDIFVYDTTQPVAAPVVRRMSVTAAGAEGSDPTAAGFKLGSINPTISSTGRFVAFASLCDNLTTGDFIGQFKASDSNVALDIFVRDRDSTASGTFDTVAATTQIVSVNNFGYQTSGLLGVASTAANNIYPTMSADGRFIALPSDSENNGGLAFGSTNQIPLDSNSSRDIFLFDRRTTTSPSPGVMPVVTITSPGNASSALVNTAISVTASATTTIGVVANVQFFVNGTSIGTSTVFPYAANWTPTAVGTYTLSALVTDSFGNLGVSTNVTVTINAAPSVGLTSPVGGSSATSGTPVTVSATAAASTPGATISSVQFFASGVSIGTDNIAPYTVTWTPSGTGVYTLTAVATDSNSTTSTSPAVSFTVTSVGGGGGGGTGSTPPTVAFSTPPPTTASVNARLTLAATATAGTGLTIANVQFRVNGATIGSSSIAPYSVVWTPLALGTYTLTAVATDNLGASTTSAVATVNVNATLSVALNSPSAGTTVFVNTPQVVSASASYSNGTVTGVQFFANGTAIGAATVYPYEITWTPTTVGTFSLTATATDNTGAQAVSTANVVTVGAGTAPTVTLSNPANGATLPAGQPLTLVANASSASGTLTGVQFYANGVLLGGAIGFPYNFAWTPAGTGTVALTAVATDSLGNRTASPVINVTVAGLSSGAPTIALTSPTAGASLAVGVPATLAATASDADGFVASVAFFANGALIGTKNTFPFTLAFTPTAPGLYVITAQATDNGGNLATSAALTVSVSGGTAPAVSLTAPAGGTSIAVNTPQTITASATSSGGFITSVQFFVNGVSLSSDTTYPYSAVWSPTALGSYSLTARATDNLGNFTDSAPILISAGASASPTVRITNPTSGSSFTVGTALNLSADAADPDGTIAAVQFIVNGLLQGGAVVVAPYRTAWTAASAGVYTVTAQATDNTGNVTLSAPVTVTIGSNAAPTVSLSSPATGSYALGNQVLVSAAAADSDGTVANVQFFANGLAIGTATAAPFNFSWRPPAAGTYSLTALATDNAGNATTSSPVSITITSTAAPSATISNPVAGTSYLAGNLVPIVATTGGGNGPIAQVQFFVNGTSLGTDTTFPYSAQWTPAAPGTYSLLAIATDSAGISSAATAALSIVITGNQPPAVAITAPGSGTGVNAGSIVNLVAAASDVDGTIATVRFLANGNAVGVAATAAPFNVAWTPSAAGAYSIVAQATDNSGNVTNSTAIIVNVAANAAPTVLLTAPTAGSVVRTGGSTALTATATDSDGTIASVQFFANGTAAGAAITAVSAQGGYRSQWTPTAEGIYRITAIAVDNAGAATTSATVMVLAVSAANGGTDTVYSGTYSAAGETGRFAVISVRGKSAAFIGYSTTGAARTYYFPGLSVDNSGSFSLADSLGRTAVSGSVNETGVTGSLDNGRVFFIGPVAFPAASGSFASGYYTGNITGSPSSTLAAIIGPDGSIILYAANGTLQVAGAGSVDQSGNFSITALGGARFTGKADPTTGFLSGSLSGTGGGTFTAATASGASFSDGFLRNLSTRGQVGTGSNILIAGFVVGGTVPKQVLVRAIGPTLSAFGLTGALVDPQLQIFNSSGALVVANNNWGGAGDVINASAAVGAFPLSGTSLDAVALASLAPGAYTAQVSGTGGGTGVALVELYDVDSLQPFSTQKVMNVATRGVVGTGQAQLIAGFIVSGNTSKKVLIRAVGPTLAAAPFNVAGVLADPSLRLVRGDNLVIRENDNWESGNDAALINEASVKVGAFPLAAGGKDSAILLNLPPGTYSAQVTGSGTTTGVALVEVYEVP